MLAEVSPFLDRECTNGACILVLVLGVIIAYSLFKPKEDHDD